MCVQAIIMTGLLLKCSALQGCQKNCFTFGTLCISNLQSFQVLLSFSLLISWYPELPHGQQGFAVETCWGHSTTLFLAKNTAFSSVSLPQSFSLALQNHRITNLVVHGSTLCCLFSLDVLPLGLIMSCCMLIFCALLLSTNSNIQSMGAFLKQASLTLESSTSSGVINCSRVLINSALLSQIWKLSFMLVFFQDECS